MTNKNEIIEKSYDWATNVVIRQGRFLSINDMWIAYPFKKTGLTKEGLNLLLEEMKKTIKY